LSASKAAISASTRDSLRRRSCAASLAARAISECGRTRASALASAIDVPVPGKGVLDQEHDRTAGRVEVRRPEQDDRLARAALDHLEVLRVERRDGLVLRVDGDGVDPHELRRDRKDGVAAHRRRLLRERGGREQQARESRDAAARAQ
jgi:hypothetical protein